MLSLHCSQPALDFRYPVPGKGPVDLTGFEGQLGFTAVVVADVQRVLACLHMSIEDDSGLDLTYVAAVASGAASNAFSSKVVTPMSAQAEWRPARQTSRAHILDSDPDLD